MTTTNPQNTNRPIPAILQTLVESSRTRLENLKRERTLDELMSVGRVYPKRSLAGAIKSNVPAVIAEVKKASPSRGVFRGDFDPEVLVRHYQEGGAAAISIVTEPDHFQGNGAWIGAVRAQVELPILRKDLIIDELQVAETAAMGADAILLIARILDTASLNSLSVAAAECGLEVLYEAHDSEDLSRIAAVEASLVGINARNLDDFTVDTQRFIDLRKQMAASVLAVAESGIESPEQIAGLQLSGYSGFLIGESLIRADHPGDLLRRLRGAN